ncbi:hypothetical protein ACKKBG_A15470 [Auxenochlorella protothecoides x Auxenochlorella symbiontica]
MACIMTCVHGGSMHGSQSSRRPASLTRLAHHARPSCRPGRALTRLQAGKEPGGGWLDLSNFVSSSGKSGQDGYSDLSEAIGRDVYIDVSGWHLYLRDVKVPDSGGTTLASGLAAMLAQEGDGADVAGVLGQVPVPLGGGQVTLSLADVVPKSGVRNLENLFKDWLRDL